MFSDCYQTHAQFMPSINIQKNLMRSIDSNGVTNNYLSNLEGTQRGMEMHQVGKEVMEIQRRSMTREISEVLMEMEEMNNP